MKVIRSALIEEGGNRYVEYVFADTPTLSEAEQFLHFRLRVDPEEHPHLEESQIAALLDVRAKVAAESSRISAQLRPYVRV